MCGESINYAENFHTTFKILPTLYFGLLSLGPGGATMITVEDIFWGKLFKTLQH